MSDLVDYLRDKLNACQCADGFFVGRPSIGNVTIKKWSPVCRVHTTEAELEAENDRARNLLFDAWARQQEDEAARAKRLEEVFWPKRWWWPW